jgi:hypothetical protein
VAHLLFCNRTKPNKKSKRATKPTHQDSSKQWTTEQQQTERQQVTAVLQKSGFSGYLNILPRINFCGILTV